MSNQVNYNRNCASVKRLLREAAELSEPTADYAAHPLDDNLFEWHFTIRGPSDSEFAEGIYHGRIIFPTEYPMKPPAFSFLTPNGRYATGEKICLSISNYHPETWLPSWSIRTALIAIISFMTTPGNQGNVGELNYPIPDRKVLALRSGNWSCPSCGSNRDQLLKDKQDASAEDNSDVDPVELTITDYDNNPFQNESKDYDTEQITLPNSDVHCTVSNQILILEEAAAAELTTMVLREWDNSNGVIISNGANCTNQENNIVATIPVTTAAVDEELTPRDTGRWYDFTISLIVAMIFYLFFRRVYAIYASLF